MSAQAYLRHSMSSLHAFNPHTSCSHRYVGGLLLLELLRALPEAFSARSSMVLPLAFSAKMDEDKEVAGIWSQVQGIEYRDRVKGTGDRVKG